MNKTALVFTREYLTRVKKKSFLLTTILVPVVIVLFYAIIIYISINGDGDEKKIAVIDEANLFGNVIEKNDNVNYSIVHNENENNFVKKYSALGYDAFLYIPVIDIAAPKNIEIHSQNTASLSTMSNIEEVVNKAVEKKRMLAQGIDPEKYKQIKADVTITNTIDTKEGSKKSVAGIAYAVSFACGMLIYMMMLIYGTQVMRGVMEEKTNRIAEVMVSSVKPFQLMMGKILGIGAVGLTQFFIWFVLIFSLQFAVPLFFPDISNQLAHVNATGADNEMQMASQLLQGFSSLPILKIISSFVFYFLGGYLMYASIFAAIGSVVSDDQQDAQQLVFPVMMPIILGFVIMSNAINEPNSSMAIFGSIFPLTSPIVMMGRITFNVPLWEMIASMLSLAAAFIFFTWLTAKIYRVGILMYGKKPTWKEMLKWAFRKN